MGFSKIEYKDRLKKVQLSMQKNGIELLISQDTANINYLKKINAFHKRRIQAKIKKS